MKTPSRSSNSTGWKGEGSEEVEGETTVGGLGGWLRGCFFNKMFLTIDSLPEMVMVDNGKLSALSSIK